ncbi:MAP kinase-interacting serine/threonine-protein kinase 1-like [Aplysia californica]|uniref:MAP kinase-interacting serine/threonine-protein kinase 1-like n=1 Tax=Aplysia californica TaxID=6500 RepID=A0ABM0K8N6_APLCA|nr:MAP kinase-interacting serine/threonine-protein kinase 1-like [Aplysia californica]
MLRTPEFAHLVEILELRTRELEEGIESQAHDSGSNNDSALRSSNVDKASSDSVIHTSTAKIASNGTMSHTTTTDKNVAPTETAPSSNPRKRRRQRKHGDAKRRVTSEVCTGGVFPAPNTYVPSCDVICPTTTTNNTGVALCDVMCPTKITNNTGVASCDVTSPTTTTNNTCGDYARAETSPTHSKKGKRRQRKRHTNGGKFFELYEATGEPLGDGSFGTVSTYRHKETGREHAVKVIKNCRGETLQLVMSEIEVCQRYRNCDNILNFQDFYTSGDTFFLVFDKMAGGDLSHVFESTPYLSESQASRVTGAVARALLTLHKDGVAHRDVKPENILCHAPGEINPVVLCDFGLASDPPSRRDPSDWDMTTKPALLKSAVGCPEYMAPEIAGLLLLPTSRRATAPYYDTSCDMWSLGVLLFEMLFARLPFPGDCGRHGETTDPSCGDCHKNVFPKVCRGDYVIPNTLRSVSDAALDLIRNLLVLDPQARYSAGDVLRHPFVTSHRDDDVAGTDCLTASP